MRSPACMPVPKFARLGFAVGELLAKVAKLAVFLPVPTDLRIFSPFHLAKPDDAVVKHGKYPEHRWTNIL